MILISKLGKRILERSNSYKYYRKEFNDHKKRIKKLEEIEAVYDRTQILRVQDEVSGECRIVKRDIYRINVLKNGELDFVECFHQTPMSDSEVLKLLDEVRHKIEIHPIA